MKVFAVLLFLTAVLAAETTNSKRVRHRQRDTERCRLPADVGDCQKSLRRWYFDIETRQCKTFAWGGCGGNENLFRSRSQCVRQCQDVATDSLDEEQISTTHSPSTTETVTCPPTPVCTDDFCPPGFASALSTDTVDSCPACVCRPLPSPTTLPSTPVVTDSVEQAMTSTACPPVECNQDLCISGQMEFGSDDNECPVCHCVPLADAVTDVLEMATPGQEVRRCPTLECDDFRCGGGARKIDAETGCETCDCADATTEVASTDSIACATCDAICAERGSARMESTACDVDACQCVVDDVETPKPEEWVQLPETVVECPPVQIDCEERSECARTKDENGCDVCACAVAVDVRDVTLPLPTVSDDLICPELSCPSTCDWVGFTSDENGCRQCSCADPAESLAPCEPVDCSIVCVGVQFTTEIDENGCETCSCAAADGQPEVAGGDNTDDVISLCACSPEACADGTACRDCDCAQQADEKTPDYVVSEEVPILETPLSSSGCPPEPEACEPGCGIGVDDAGCDVCVCSDTTETDTEMEITTGETESDEIPPSPTFAPPESTDDDEKRKSDAVDEDAESTSSEATTDSIDDADRYPDSAADECDQLTCHPSCRATKNDRGCDIACHCDDDMGPPINAPTTPRQEPEPEVACAGESVQCACDDGQTARTEIDASGCAVCKCLETSVDVEQSVDVPDVASSAEELSTTTDAAMVEAETTTDEPENSPCPTNEQCPETMDCGTEGFQMDENGCTVCACVRTPKLRNLVHFIVAKARKGSCSLAMERGPCRAEITRWYHDVTTDSCVSFTYGGCRGNANNFRSEKACQRYCKPEVDNDTIETRSWYNRILGLMLSRDS